MNFTNKRLIINDQTLFFIFNATYFEDNFNLINVKINLFAHIL